ncbi:hypothetical protein SFC81_05845 [Enterococcus faecalis]
MKKMIQISLLVTMVLGLATIDSTSTQADTVIDTYGGIHDWGDSNGKFPSVPTAPGANQSKHVASILDYTMFGDSFTGVGLPTVKYAYGVLNFNAKITSLNPGYHTIKNANLIGLSRSGKVKVFAQIGQTPNEWIDFKVNLSSEDLKDFSLFTVTANYHDNLWGQNTQARASISLSSK